MRKLKLLIATLALVVGGVNYVNAYSTADLESAGWTKVTDLSTVTLADNYFIFVDGQEGKYTMANAMPKGILTGVARPMFQEIEDPTSATGQVWVIENYDTDNYAIKSIVDNFHLNSNGEWWSSHVSGDYGDTSKMKLLSIADGKYRLQTTGTSTFWGPYNDNPTVALGNTGGMDFESDASDSHYAAIAANKAEANAPGFYIYAIARTSFDASRRCEAALVSEGWTKVTATDGLGKQGYYYAFLDASENGGESGFAMTGTDGRPKYKLEKDPIADNTQLWTTEAHGSGYAIKNVADNKYIYAAASWNMQATDNINTANTDFIANVNDGVWTLSNSISTGEFIGNYKNSPYNPTDGEDLAANKASKKGKRTFLIYSIPTIAGVATALPANGDMAADTWYYLDITAAANNYTATATTLGDIVYSTDPATTLVKNLTTNTFTAENNSLSATRYYVKSSTANNLVIGVASYTYTVGSAATDKTYIQAGNTVTISYSDLGTNDPNATLTQDLSGVTFGGSAITCTATDNGFTFTVPTVTANTQYTLSIPANAMGYAAGSTFNEAQTFTFWTPAVFDGYYFLKTADNKYLSRGGNYNTQAVVDNYGIPMRVTTNSNGITEFIFVDNWFHLFNPDNGNLFTDNNTANDFQILAHETGYYVVNKNETNTKDGKFYIDGTAVKISTTETPTTWLFEDATTTVHKTQMQAVKDAQAASAATSAGINASTQSALASELSTNYGETEIAITGTGGTVKESWQQEASNTTGNELAIFAEETVSGLTPGLYRLRVNAFERITWLDDVLNVGGAAGLTYVYANDQKIQLCSVAETYKTDGAWSTATPADVQKTEGYYVNNTTSANAAFTAGNYVNDVYVWVTADEGQATGTIKFGIKKPNRYGNVGSRGAWVCYNNFSLTYFEAKATEAEKQALANAITAAEAKTLGFETNEYAPYNNVAALEALATANAIDANTASGASVVAATTALTGATWTANSGEVNAIYDGTFTNAPVADATSGVNGWSAATGLRQLVKSEVENSIVATGMYVWGNNAVTYGETTGYTMPLKPNAVYKLTYDRASWSGSSSSHSDITVKDPSGTSLGTAIENGYAGDWNTTDGTLLSRTIYFVTGEAGNYTITVAPWGNTVYTNMNLYKTTDALEFADGSVPSYVPGTYPSVKISRTLTANRWATAVYPFAVSGVDNIAVLNSYNKETGALGFATANASTANVPFLMKSTAAASEISLSNVEVAAANATDATASEAKLIGRYETTTVEAGSGVYNYVLSNNNIYKIGSNAATINPYRAYIQVTQPTEARALTFFIDGDETTGIEGISVENENGTIYNLNGQRVDKAQRGLYIKNGKKVIVK